MGCVRRASTWIGIGVGAAMLAMAGTASAIPLTLTGPIAGNTVGPQSTSNPCIIAGTNCSQPAGFGFNNFTSSGAITSYNMYSTTPTGTVADGVQGTPYTVQQIDDITNNEPFRIAIDVNTTAAAGETLQLFEVIVNGVVVYNYIGPTNIAGISNNGNGFGDWTLGDIDLSGFAQNATVLFHAVWTGATDGAESFFIVGVPFAAVGAGLPGLVLACGALVAFGHRRRRQRLA